MNSARLAIACILVGSSLISAQDFALKKSPCNIPSQAAIKKTIKAINRRKKHIEPACNLMAIALLACVAGATIECNYSSYENAITFLPTRQNPTCSYRYMYNDPRSVLIETCPIKKESYLYSYVTAARKKLFGQTGQEKFAEVSTMFENLDNEDEQ